MTTGNVWTDKHDAYCLKHGITPSAKQLLQWLVSRSEAPEQEPDLAEFNAWVEKHRGKGYHRDTLKRAIATLIECKIVTPLKKFSWRIWRLILRPIGLISSPPNLRKKSRLQDCDRDPEASNPQSADAVALAAAVSNLDLSELDSEVLETCSEAGIPFRSDEAGNVLKHSIDEVREAIAHFRRRGGHDKIENPQGWLIECLRRRWWEDATNYYSAHSPIAKRQTQEWIKAGRSVGERREATANV